MRHAPGSARGRFPAIAGSRGLRRRRIPATEGHWARGLLDRVVRRVGGQGSAAWRDVARPSGTRRSLSDQRFFSDHPYSWHQEHDLWRRRNFPCRAHRPGTGLATNPPHREAGSPADAVHAFAGQREDRRRSGRRDRGLAAQRVKVESFALPRTRVVGGRNALLGSIPSTHRRVPHPSRSLRRVG